MKNGFFSSNTPIREAVIEFCSVPRSRAELISFVGKSKNHVMSHIVAPLVASGELKMTIPDKPNSPNQKYLKS